MTTEIRTPVDAYLDAVDLALLKAGAPRSRRTAIIADLESHILDALAEKPADPTPADVAALLATLGPPEAYASGMTIAGAPSPVRPPRRTLPIHAKWALLLLAAGLLGIIILTVNFAPTIPNPSDFLLLIIAGTPAILMIALASFLGLVSFRTIHKNPRRHWGRPIALLELVAFPVLLALASPFLLLAIVLAAILALIVHRLYNLPNTARTFLAPA